MKVIVFAVLAFVVGCGGGVSTQETAPTPEDDNCTTVYLDKDGYCVEHTDRSITMCGPDHDDVQMLCRKVP